MISSKFSSFLKPPSLLKGSSKFPFEKNAFHKSILISAISVAPNKISKIISHLLPDTLLALPRIKTIIHDKNCSDSNLNKNRLILLGKDGDSLSESEISCIAENDAKIIEHELLLDYSYWQVDEILAAILPDGMQIPSSFETAGHIAHLNLRDEQLPYKQIIGQVILDKNPAIRTVLNKTANISNTFRVFPMELIAGVQDLETVVKEQNCFFQFDFSKVYWNSRLQFEHERLVGLFQKGDFICDVFAGVGPFAIPAVKLKDCTVFANDLNPDSVHWLRKNCIKNKINSSKLHIYNEDAAQFIQNSQLYLKAAFPEAHFGHYVMNLPAAATSFLHNFQQLDLVNSPTIHCYLFVKDVEGKEAVDPANVVIATLPELALEIIHVQNVRSVAPLKTMYCVSFKISHPTSKRFKSVD